MKLDEIEHLGGTSELIIVYVVANRVVGVIMRAWVQTLIHTNFYPQWALASPKPFSFHPHSPMAFSKILPISIRI